MSSKILMTNKEAANELKELIEFYRVIPRGNGKSAIPALIKTVALQKAIDVLEKTPD